MDVDELRAFCVFQGSGGGSGGVGGVGGVGGGSEGGVFGPQHPTALRFFRVIRSMRADEQRALLLFFTGSARVPLDGFDPPVLLTQAEGGEEGRGGLPRAHTCFHQLVLPAYDSDEQMKERLLFAALNADGFELA